MSGFHVSFLQFYADVSKHFKAVTAIYVYATESSRFALLENDIGYAMNCSSILCYEL